jgi:hypothetical protein
VPQRSSQRRLCIVAGEVRLLQLDARRRQGRVDLGRATIAGQHAGLKGLDALGVLALALRQTRPRLDQLRARQLALIQRLRADDPLACRLVGRLPRRLLRSLTGGARRLQHSPGAGLRGLGAGHTLGEHVALGVARAQGRLQLDQLRTRACEGLGGRALLCALRRQCRVHLGQLRGELLGLHAAGVALGAHVGSVLLDREQPCAPRPPGRRPCGRRSRHARRVPRPAPAPRVLGRRARHQHLAKPQIGGLASGPLDAQLLLEVVLVRPVSRHRRGDTQRLVGVLGDQARGLRLGQVGLDS